MTIHFFVKKYILRIEIEEEVNECINECILYLPLLMLWNTNHKQLGEGECLFGLQPVSSGEARVGAQGEDLEAGAEADTTKMLHWLSRLPFFCSQAQLPRGGTSPSGLGLPKSIINQNISDMPTSQSDRGHSRLRSFSSVHICQVCNQN